VLAEGQYEKSADLDPSVTSSSPLTDYINKALVRGREIIVQSWRDYFTIVSTPFAVVQGTDSYALPSDFEHLRKAEIAIDAAGTRWRKLLPADLSDSTRFQNSTSRRYRYRLQGGAAPFVLMPVPGNSTDLIRVWYIPYATELVNLTDAVTINVDVEYELYVALALRKCRIREDLDTRVIDQTIAECEQRLASMADERDAGEPFYLGTRSGDEEGEYDW
jgi:hypothetical protein